MTAVLGRVRLVPPGPEPGAGPEADPPGGVRSGAAPSGTASSGVAAPEIASSGVAAPAAAGPAPPATASSDPGGPGAPRPGAGSGVPRRLRRLWVLPAAVVVAGALALVPVVRDDGPGPGEAEVQVDGTATVARAGGGSEVVEDGSVRLGPGDVIEVTAGTARFARPDDVTFEGRAGPAVAGRAGTTVEMGVVPELVAGPLLVVAPVPAELRAAGSTLVLRPAGAADGAARLDRRLGLGVGTYRGSVDVDSAGRAARVAALRRLEVAAPGSLGRRDLPVEYDAADRWDRRFLADALLVDAQLAPVLSALDAIGSGPATVAGLGRALPGLSRDGAEAVVAVAPTGSAALVTAVLVDRGRGGTVTSRVDAVQRFRDDGAPWGLVALDRRVAPSVLLADVRAALDRLGPDAPLVASAGEGAGAEPTTPGSTPGSVPGEASTTVPEPSPGSGSGGGRSTDVGGSGGGALPPVPPGVVPPPPSLPVPPVDGGTVGGVVDGVGETVGGVVEGAGEVVGGVVEGAGSTLGGVLDGLLGAAGDLLGGGSSGGSSSGGGLGLGLGGL